MTDWEIKPLASRFERFSELEAREMSPFYAFLAGEIAKDEELLNIICVVAPGQPPANMIFAAVRRLLDGGAGSELLAAYPTDWNQSWPSHCFELFREFVVENCRDIQRLLNTKNVQSNIVRRTSVLRCGLSASSAEFGNDEFTNIEIGASAGLTLMWQKLRYRYIHPTETVGIGADDQSVAVETNIRGGSVRKLLDATPKVVRDIGVEIAPVDIEDVDSVSWLRALIWPEHDDNRRLFDVVLELAREAPPEIKAGDAITVLPELIDSTSEGAVNVYHSHTLNQFTQEAKVELDSILCGESVSKKINRLGFEGSGRGYSVLSLTTYRDGDLVKTKDLAHCEPHGRWIEWL